MKYIPELTDHHNRRYSNALERHPDNTDLAQAYFLVVSALGTLNHQLKTLQNDD